MPEQDEREYECPTCYRTCVKPAGVYPVHCPECGARLIPVIEIVRYVEDD